MNIVLRIRKVILLFFFFFILFWCVIAESEVAVRSTSLFQKVTISNNSMRIDYIDENGVITYAADLCYATMIRTWGDHYEIDEYYDTEGNPAMHRMRYYAIKKEFDELGRTWRVSYLGIDHEPVIWNNGYAIVVRNFYENGNIKTEHYLDEQGNPIMTNAYGYGCHKEYDQDNRNNVLIYLGDDEKPTVTGQGYAIVRRIYYEEGHFTGQVKEEYYFNPDDEPTILLYGQSGVRKEYDQFGRVATMTYLDADGNPIITRRGYTTIKRTYYEDDEIESEMYFDMNGELVSLSEGQYGIRYIGGKTVYLNRFGKEQLNIKQILYNNEWIVILVVICIVVSSVFTGRKLNGIFFVLYLFAIVYMTLMYRTKMVSEHYSIIQSLNGNQLPNNILSKGIIDNILLFLPLGTILYRIHPQKNILFVPVLISICIELTQYIFKIGLFEPSDIISNSLGGILGFFVSIGLTELISMLKGEIGKNRLKTLPVDSTK